MTQRTTSGEIKQVDFLATVVGLATKDLMRRSLEVDVPDIGRLRVMHPVDVLDSRIQNLALLPQKRNLTSVAQGRLAVEVVRTFIRQEMSTGSKRAGLKLVEWVAVIAQDIAAVRVFISHAIDPREAVPVEDLRSMKAFQELRWPISWSPGSVPT